MILQKIVGVVVLVLGIAGNGYGEAIRFGLLDQLSLYSQLDNRAAGSVTNGGLVAMLVASDGMLNRTTAGFGINGTGSDDTDGLNAGQYIDIWFDQIVVFNNLNVSSWGASDAGEVQLRTTNGLIENGSIGGTGDTAFSFEVKTGHFIRILAQSDSGTANGFSVDSFTVAIPEPAAAALIALVGVGSIVIRRFVS